MSNLSTTELVNSAYTSIDPITDDVRHVIQITNYVVICGVISLFGIGANVINISVFVRQGCKDSINISLLGLSVADLVCSFTMFFNNMFYTLLLQNLDLSFAPLDVMYITGGWTHVCFNRITSFITAFITLERCLCIAMPLKVKNIITPFRTKVIIVTIFTSTSILFLPFYFVNKLDWVFNPSRNRSIIGLTFTQERGIVESITSIIHSVFLSFVLLLSVVVCTIILVVKLNQKTKWRKQSVAHSTCKQEAISAKEKNVVKMVILISNIFIVCYIPPTVLFLVIVFFRELGMGGLYENTYYVVWSALVILDGLNSSVNMVVYFNMSTKYRAAILEMFGVLSEKLSTSSTGSNS